MHPETKTPSTSRRTKAPVALAIAGLLGATALTVPFLTSQQNLISTPAIAATQPAAPAYGFADLVEKVKPAVVSVKVKNGGYKSSSNRHHDRNKGFDGFPGGEMFKRFFDGFEGHFDRQSYDGEGDRRYGYDGRQYDGFQQGQQYRSEDHTGAYDGNNGQFHGDRQQGYRFDGNDRGGYSDEQTSEYGGHERYQGTHRYGNRRHDGHRDRPHSSQGSGFVISADGYVVTNHHVVDGGDKIEIKMSDGQTYEAKVIGTDKKTDLALLKIDADRTFEFVSFTDAAARVGDWVIAVGNPFGLGGTVTTGIVSARGRDLGSGPYDDYIQIDAPINRGNSGGPAFNLDGQVIGVNTAIFSPSGGNVGIGFAIPAAIAKQVIDDLKDDGKVTRGWLGIQIQPVTSDIADGLGIEHTKGAIVSLVQDGSPAEQAGLKVGDLVLQVAGEQVDSPKDLARKVGRIAPGTEVELSVYRKGETITLKVSLGTQSGQNEPASEEPAASPSPTSLGSLGLSLESADGGVVISSVDADGLAAKKGLKPGDQILEIGGEEVTSPQQVEDRLKAMSAKGRKAVLLLVRSESSQRFVAVELPKS